LFDGLVHFNLHGLEKLDALRVGGIVIDAGGVDVGDLLVKPPLGGADVLNPAEQFIEVIEWLVGVFEPFVVENEPLDDELDFSSFARWAEKRTSANRRKIRPRTGSEYSDCFNPAPAQIGLPRPRGVFPRLRWRHLSRRGQSTA